MLCDLVNLIVYFFDTKLLKSSKTRGCVHLVSSPNLIQNHTSLQRMSQKIQFKTLVLNINIRLKNVL